MANPKRSAPAAKGGRATLLWLASLVLAAAATAALIVVDDVRLVRLGLVAALWSALLGAFGVARLRNRLIDGDERFSDLHRIYQLELEKEIAARQEHELEVENQAHRNAAENVAEEIRALRAELRSLRSMVEPPTGGTRRESGHPPAGNSPQPTQSSQSRSADHYGILNDSATGRNRSNVNHLTAASPQEASSQDLHNVDRAAAHGWTSQVTPGAHAQGTSVTDLLATYGDVEDSPRRSRRTG